MKHLSHTLICIGILFVSGCSTTKFIIHSDPEDAYIVGYGETSDAKPIDGKVTFLGKSDNYSFVAMKRGYHPDTITVFKDSPSDLNFHLMQIEGGSPVVRKPADLNLKNANLLPVSVEIVLHKGVGALDKYEKSEELSVEACSGLNHELQLIQSDTTISFLSIHEDPDWPYVSRELEQYLKKLDPALLDYYPIAPSVSGILEGNKELFLPVIEPLNQSAEKEYLVFGWCKSVRPTTGRVVGNIGVAAASVAVAGYETATYGVPVTYSDPSAFTLDNNTIFVAYAIDPASGEVIEISQYVVPYDITTMERLQMIARSIILFPLAESHR